VLKQRDNFTCIRALKFYSVDRDSIFIQSVKYIYTVCLRGLSQQVAGLRPIIGVRIRKYKIPDNIVKD